MPETPAFSDYIVYVDESSDHSLTSIDDGFPLFTLAFCVFKKSDYTADLVARPIALRVLRPGQENRAYDLIVPKLVETKVFP